MDKKDYLSLITSEYYDKKNFLSYVDTTLNPINEVANLHENMNTYFAIDTAVGKQLDIVGQYLNITRELPFQSTILPSVLTDDLFRFVIKCRVLQYRWDGTIEGILNIVESVVPGTLIQITDNQDMSYLLTVVSSTFNEQIGELFLNGYVTPKPAGVKVNYMLYERPFFSWDKDTTYQKGWDEGIWM